MLLLMRGSYLHLFTRLPVTSNVKISIFFLTPYSPTLPATGRSHYWFPFTYYTVTSHGEPEFTAAPGSVAPSNIILELAASCCLDKYYGQQLSKQLMRDEVSKTASAPKNAYPSGLKRVLLWTAKMHLDLLWDPELADACVSAVFHSAILHFLEGSQVTFCIVGVGL